MSHSLKVKARITILQDGCHRLQAWIDSYTGTELDGKVFVYQRFPTVPGETSPDDRFVNVASVADLKDYPADNPNTESPFFRLISIDLVFRSVDLLNRTWESIVEDLRALISNLNKLETLGTNLEIDIG
jgi:hypothetical protein